MVEWTQANYDWIRALHVISIIAWMAGLLYLPRLFVYHTMAEPGSAQSETFKIMERRLLQAIMHPSLIASLLTGGLLLAALGEAAWQAGWMHLKLACVVGLVGLHFAMGRWRRDFAEDANKRSETFYRVVNEAPTVLMIAAVIAVVVEPF